MNVIDVEEAAPPPVHSSSYPRAGDIVRRAKPGSCSSRTETDYRFHCRKKLFVLEGRKLPVACLYKIEQSTGQRASLWTRAP